MAIRGCTWLLLLLLPLLQGQNHQPLRRSKRRWVLTTLELEEEDPGPFPKLVGELFNNMSNNVSLMYLLRGPGVDEFPEIGLFSIEDHQSGKVYVHRAVDREVTPSFLTAPWFTLIVRATDCGEPSLSSTATIHISVEEGNNHMPTFVEDHYEIQISEGEVAWGVLDLPVQDGDSPFTPAWRAQFHILDGNEEEHFDIMTDPETNRAVLNVIKPLDYETQAAHSLSIVVENQEPLFSCEEGQAQPSTKAMASTTVSVQVVDTNDPPAFHPRSFIVSKEDGAGPGIWLGDFNATDPDRVTSQIRYKLVHDPADWVTVDEETGAVTTKRQIDRESPHVNGSFYTILVHAVDSGLPPLTGTGTLMLFLSDINDNAPTLQSHSRHLEICESAGNQPLLLEAEDGDLDPYSNPFTFDLDSAQRDVDGTWMLRTKQGEGRSAELVMLRSLPPGEYLVPLFIGDRQGLTQRQTVHVRVCSCPSGSKCETLSNTGLLLWVLSPVCAALLVLAAALLSLLRCRFEFGPKRLGGVIPSDNGHQTLIVYNEESQALSAQMQPTGGGQMPALSFSAAAAYAKPDVKKLHAIDVQDSGTGYPPHVYREEGESEGAETLSSLTFLEQDLPPELLDYLSLKSTPSEAMCSASRVPS
ncbi:Cadherin-like protein 26 [Microtus ochrogaster]|uniref:Cadherin-like protein 26 n=1 Tax=Microtus ochrogaster TaxID=79684 RepID=A0A8J6GJV1_MICOH|nr:Cadherin-like protein 26 [Microtus ochrogaster]